MTHAIRLHATGGPDVLALEPHEPGPPGPGEVRLRHEAIGVNFIDVYHRAGLYQQPLPLVPGTEGAGVVTALGPGVTEWRVGARVAYAGTLTGAYAEERNYPADRLVPVPEGVTSEVAAAALLKGLTAEYLLQRTWPLKAGDAVLVHAAAGGVGLLLVQWAKRLGLRVIGVVSNGEKAAIATHHGADRVIVRPGSDASTLAADVKAANDGRGVDVVFDSVGKDTFVASLDSLRPRGLLVSYGNASGAVPAFEPALLSAKGSLFLTRPTMGHYFATPADRLTAAGELFRLIVTGALTVPIHASIPLANAADAHRLLESRTTSGSLVLVP